MKYNGRYTNVSTALPSLLNTLNEDGVARGSRAGETTEITHVGVTLVKPWQREVLCNFRKPNLAAQIAETMWVLAGKDDIGWLEHYLPRVREFSDDGIRWRAGYGARLRSWSRRDESGDVVDQWRWLIDHLKAEPDSRRGVMSIWDPIIDTVDGKDIPCNDWLSFLHRDGSLDLHVAVRSNDVIWGWSGINQFEWSALLEITAGLLGMETGMLHFSTTSFHLYDHHYDKADKIMNAAESNPDQFDDSPRFQFDGDFDSLDSLLHEWFVIEKMIRHGDPSREEVEAFPEPMLRSWLRVLQWWWSGDKTYVTVLEGTRLGAAVDFSVKSPRDLMMPPPPVEGSEFIKEICALHIQKEAAYGGSWKKRGELFSILPNIGRKVDRLSTGVTTDDETSADTAGDLFVYLAKYKTWLDETLFEEPLWAGISDSAKYANQVMVRIEQRVQGRTVPDAEYLKDSLVEMYETLLELAEVKDSSRRAWVDTMLSSAYMLARLTWDRENSDHLPLDEYQGADHD